MRDDDEYDDNDDVQQSPIQKENGVFLRDCTFFGNDFHRFSITGVSPAHSVGCLCPPLYAAHVDTNGISSPRVLNLRAQTQCRDSQTRCAPPCTVPLRMGGISYIYRVRVNFSGLVCFAQPIEIRKVRNHCTKPVAMETIKQ